MQNEKNPGYTPPPAAADLPPAPRGADAGAAPSSLFNSTFAKASGFAAGLLLVLYVLWPLIQPLWAPARRGPLPGDETTPVSQAEAAPERIAHVAAAPVQAENLTPPTGGFHEEDIVPPLPGLLLPRVLSSQGFSYGGSRKKPAELAKDTAESRADCKEGDMFECLRLGWQYNMGYGVKKDLKRGFSLINKACAGGIAEACTSQGIMQLSGFGTARDETAAYALFDKACGASDMYGCTMLASRDLGDENTPAEISRGLGLLKRACDASLPLACYFLGTIHAEGKVVPRDAAEADRLLGKACDLNNKDACQLLQQLRQHAAAENKP